jgi:hypothetical protein
VGTDALAFHSAYESNDTHDEANHAHSCEYRFTTADTPSATVKEYDPTTDDYEPNRHDNIRDSHLSGAPYELSVTDFLALSADQSKAGIVNLWGIGKHVLRPCAPD